MLPSQGSVHMVHTREHVCGGLCLPGDVQEFHASLCRQSHLCQMGHSRCTDKFFPNLTSMWVWAACSWTHTLCIEGNAPTKCQMSASAVSVQSLHPNGDAWNTPVPPCVGEHGPPQAHTLVCPVWTRPFISEYLRIKIWTEASRGRLLLDDRWDYGRVRDPWGVQAMMMMVRGHHMRREAAGNQTAGIRSRDNMRCEQQGKSITKMSKAKQGRCDKSLQTSFWFTWTLRHSWPT